MKSSLRIAVGALVILAAVSTVTGAHARDYARTLYNGGGLFTLLFSTTCIDSQNTMGLPGALGSAAATASGTLDPSTPDVNGSCWRKNHIFPNPNGDVTVTISDAVNTNVGGCISHNQNNNDLGCWQDPGDVTMFFCNQGTVNINIDPITGASAPNVWRFQDSQGVPALQTDVQVERTDRGLSLLAALIGGPELCGPGTDDHGTVGVINHS